MNLKHKLYAALAIVALMATSCDNKAQLQEMQSKYDSQVDSLNVIIDNLTRENISKNDTIARQDSLITTYQYQIGQYKDVINEYKTVLYAIVGEDGLYNYGEIDYD